MKNIILLALAIVFCPLSHAEVTYSSGNGNTLGLACSAGQVPSWSGAGFTACAANLGAAVTSINADTTAAQVIAGSNNISASTAAGTTTVNGTLLAPKASPTHTGQVTATGASGTFIVDTNLGTAAAPTFGYSAAGNANGLFSVSTSVLGLTAGSVEAARMSSTTATFAGNVAANNIWVYLDAAGAGSKNTAIFPNATSDTILLTSSNNPDTTDAAGVKLYGKTNGTPSIAEVWNAGVLTAKFTAGNAVQFPALASSSAAQTGTVCWTTGTGNLTVDTTTTCLLSTRRVKEKIKPLDIGLNEVMALSPVSFQLKKKNNPMHLGRQVGLIAEEVAQIDDRLISRDKSGEPLSVRYQQLTAVLVKAIQEQQTQIKTLQSEVALFRASVH